MRNENDYIRSLKREDSYHFSYTYEYIVRRFGDGDDDVELAIATIDITVSWDDTAPPGYITSYSVSAPTSIPNQYTGSEDDLYDEIVDMYLVSDLQGYSVSSETFKFL